MRKNAVLKSVSEIDGGLCAPNGFQKGGLHAGLGNFPTDVSDAKQ